MNPTKLEFFLFEEKVNLKAFLKTHPKVLGVGQSREVYSYNDSMVLKFAMPSKSNDGRKSNLNEVQNHECLTSRYSAKIFDFDKSKKAQEIGPEWILMEKVRVEPWGALDKLIWKAPINLSVLKKLNREPVQVFTYFGYALDSLINGKTNTEISDEMIKAFKGEWIEEFVERLKQCNVDAYDFHDQNWGIRDSTDELVLIDYGESKPKL